MSVATWELVKFEKQDASGNPTGQFVGMVGRVVYGYNQVNDPLICGLGNCCPAEGDVANHFFPGAYYLPHACFGMLGQMFWDYPHEFLNDGTVNPNWNGCPGPTATSNGFNT